jgi:hypothetical protein
MLMFKLLLLAIGTNANIVCDTVTPMTNFNGADYMGIWY